MAMHLWEEDPAKEPDDLHDAGMLLVATFVAALAVLVMAALGWLR